MPSPVRQPEQRTFGKYTLIARLAAGGMGEIFLARLQGLAGFEKIVVIKRVLPHLAVQDRYIAMLLDEARIAARLSHPNICQVQELGEVGGEYYIAMEYLEGVTLAELLRRLGKQGHVMNPSVAIAIATQACEGLHAAHELADRGGQPTNLVHRDVSPSNVFITTAGMVKILDFGIAKTPDRLSRTRTGAVKGKWAYMSPEQILRQPLDRRSDIFSLGIVLFESLTGRRLFHRPSEYEICRSITEVDAPSVRQLEPGLPEPLAEVVARALARDPAQRFTTARDMGKALLEASASFGGPSSFTHVAELVTTRFATELSERRTFIERVDASAGSDASDADAMLPLAPGMAPEAPGSEDSDYPAVPLPAATEATGMVPPLQLPGPLPEDARLTRSPGRLGVILVVLVVVVAAGLYAYNALWPRLAPSPRARVETQRGTVVPEPAGATTPALDAGATLAASPDARAVDRKPPRRRSSSREPRRDPYKRALGRRSEQLSECYRQHISAQESAPLLKLVLRIDTDGKVMRAELQPGSYGDTPLGRCVLGLVRDLDFGPHEAPTDVRIPLRIRLTRGG